MCAGSVDSELKGIVSILLVIGELGLSSGLNGDSSSKGEMGDKDVGSGLIREAFRD